MKTNFVSSFYKFDRIGTTNRWLWRYTFMFFQHAHTFFLQKSRCIGLNQKRQIQNLCSIYIFYKQMFIFCFATWFVECCVIKIKFALIFHVKSKKRIKILSDVSHGTILSKNHTAPIIFSVWKVILLKLSQTSDLRASFNFPKRSVTAILRKLYVHNRNRQKNLYLDTLCICQIKGNLNFVPFVWYLLR